MDEWVDDEQMDGWMDEYIGSRGGGWVGRWTNSWVSMYEERLGSAEAAGMYVEDASGCVLRK